MNINRRLIMWPLIALVAVVGLVLSETVFNQTSEECVPVRDLLEFNQAQDAMLLERVHSVARRDGLRRTGLAAGSVLSILALAVVLLKVDTATKGYYSKRLFIGVPAAIIGMFFLLLLAT